MRKLDAKQMEVTQGGFIFWVCFAIGLLWGYGLTRAIIQDAQA
jgi:hypothetical protein